MFSRPVKVIKGMGPEEEEREERMGEGRHLGCSHPQPSTRQSHAEEGRYQGAAPAAECPLSLPCPHSLSGDGCGGKTREAAGVGESAEAALAVKGRQPWACRRVGQAWVGTAVGGAQAPGGMEG